MSLIRAGQIDMSGVLGFGLFSTRPPPGNAGVRFIASDGSTQCVDDGTAWRPLIGGRPGIEPPLVASGTQHNGTPTTWNDVAGTISGNVPTPGADALSSLVFAKDNTCDLKIHINSFGGTETFPGNFAISGIAVRDTAVGNSTILGQTMAGSFTVLQMFSDDIGTVITDILDWNAAFAEGAWFRFVDDNVDHFYYRSLDGVTWRLLTTHPRTTYLANGGNAIGIGMRTYGGPQSRCDSFDYVTAP